jgi:nucleoside-diphosphate-sugar epimerase
VKVVITGGAGFIGARLAKAVLARGALADGQGVSQPVDELVLFDQAAPAEPIVDDRAHYLTGDLTDAECLAAALGADSDTIFHLAAVVSGAAEADLGLGLRVNLDGTRTLLDLAADTGRRPKFLFASSLAVYGGPGASTVTDATIPTPMSSYGVQKLCCEYLIGDYDRRGLIDGRSMRFPTIAVRPGAPNAANSSFISSVIREPVAGEQTVCPVPDDVPIAVMSPDRLVAAILKVHDLPTETFGWPRSLLLPAVQVTVAEMLDALEQLMGPETRRLVRFAPDQKIIPMVRSWPAEVTSARAAGFGIETDADAMAFVSQYVAEYGPKS